MSESLPSTADLARLRAAAEAAQSKCPGKWKSFSYKSDLRYCTTIAGLDYGPDDPRERYEVWEDPSPEVVDFGVLAQPSAVLALLRLLAAQQEVLLTLAAVLRDGSADHMDDAEAGVAWGERQEAALAMAEKVLTDVSRFSQVP